MNRRLNWRLPGFGLILGLFLAALLFSLSIGIEVVPGALFGLTLSVIGISIFTLAKPTNQAPSKLRVFSEWILIGIVWILTALIALVILTLR